jgi:hypothetical protein
MGSRNTYKDMLDNVVSPITCVSMNHQNQLEQMANGAMFATFGKKKVTMFKSFVPKFIRVNIFCSKLLAQYDVTGVKPCW